MIEFDNYLSPGRKGHLVGIGGVSMSSLAEVLKGMGISVVGSDMNENPNVVSLRAHGIHVHVGHDASNITDDIEFVVRTTDRKSTRLNSSHSGESRMPSSA